MKSDLCFNFSKGKRILVYVRKDAVVETSVENDIAKTDVIKKSPKNAKVATPRR
jgi:hypothetical protein